MLTNEKIQWGYLIVPENRAAVRNGRSLRIAVAVLKSKRGKPDNDPVVYIQGGPGGGTINGIKNWLEHPLRATRDIVLVDQRGTGFSEPEFCPDLGKVFFEILAKDLSPEQEMKERLAAAMRCRNDLLSRDVDLSAYNSAAVAADLNDLRAALGYARWNLYGSSYGTRVALTLMRDFPEGIRSVILDSAVPLNGQYYNQNTANFARSLDILFDKCAADPACRGSYGNVRDTFYVAVNQLRKKPLVVPVPESLAPGGQFVLNAQDMLIAVQQALYNPKLFAVLPLLIREFKARNEETIATLVSSLGGRLGLDYGVYYTTLCNETIPFNSLEAFDAKAQQHQGLAGGLTFYRSEFAICDNWDNWVADSVESRAVTSNIPAFILAGEHDPITPPANGKLAATTLPNHFYVEMPSLGHTPGFSACGRELLTSFLDNPRQGPDRSCLDKTEHGRFVTNVLIKGGVSKVARTLSNPPPLVVAVAGAIVVILLSAVFIWPVSYAYQVLGNRSCTGLRADERTGRWLAWSASLTAVLFLAGLLTCIKNTSTDNLYILAFGLPGAYRPLFMVPYLLIVLSTGVLLVAIHAWRSGSWNRKAKIYFSVVSAACWCLVTAIVYWGLY